jgi:hypothetical protein
MKNCGTMMTNFSINIQLITIVQKEFRELSLVCSDIAIPPVQTWLEAMRTFTRTENR